MKHSVVVVESPAKARTLKKYLGEGTEVFASYGHVRDLVPKEGAVEPGADFAMRYQPIEKNERHVAAIAKAMKKAERLVLATDPDREGEAISWHLHELLEDRGALDGKDVVRVAFHEITERAIREAMEHPRELAGDLVNAQQARRALDYLVGFNLSPLLWKKIKRGLSAGRVQSPALRLIAEREEEIEAFEAREFWRIEARLAGSGQKFAARLYQYDGRKTEQFSFTDGDTAEATRSAIERAAAGRLTVAAVERKERRRNPAPPFITSTLQQEAARKLGFTTRRTMQIAQQLYEGVDLGDGPVGLISYMRTDSTHLAPEALAEMREYIAKRYGAENLPPKARVYRTRSKNAQEAHEAIRPTSVAREPRAVASRLSHDQARLYELVWNRTIACQMIHATLDLVAVDLAAGELAIFRATGSTIRHPGFMQVYLEDRDEPGEDEREEHKLPPLKKDEDVPLETVNATQHFTEPPPRYTEASLVKTLEAHGIGRPSTYAAIVQTLLAREYAVLESRHFVPSDVGRVVNRFLTQYFERYVDYDFTARLEDQLDAVSRGERDWKRVLNEFWGPFEKELKNVEENVTRRDVLQARPLGTDPQSGLEVSVRLGRYGPFVQLGQAEEENKPRFASLRPGQKLETIALDEALKLFELPRELGATQEGEKVSANIGRFGPYVRYGSKYVSLKGDDDPYSIELLRALELISEKKEADAKRLIRDYGGMRVLNGRYGPFVSDGEKNARVPKERDPATLTLDECRELLAKAPEKKRRPQRRRKTG
ncbi:MAG: DNA topoisomerase I [Gammaproteobacteria bacterium]